MEKSPIIAIVGRPNVGKSTLFNKLVGSRRVIVGDEPGITRDRIYGNAHWLGHDFRVVDTGGIMPEEKDFIPAEIFRQAGSRWTRLAPSLWSWMPAPNWLRPILNLPVCSRRQGSRCFLP